MANPPASFKNYEKLTSYLQQFSFDDTVKPAIEDLVVLLTAWIKELEEEIKKTTPIIMKNTTHNQTLKNTTKIVKEIMGKGF